MSNMNNELLSVPDSLLSNIEDMLGSLNVELDRQPDREVRSGRHTYDLIQYKCSRECGSADLAIEKRHGRSGADILIVPSRRFVFFVNPKSVYLTQTMSKLFRKNGADNSHVARCENVG